MDSSRGRCVTVALSTLGLLLIAAQPVSAQGLGGDDALGDVIIDAMEDLLEGLFSPIRDVIETHADAVLRTVVGTPHPDAVFSAPTNNAWPDIYAYYWEMILPLTLMLYGLSLGLVIFLETTSHLFSGYHRSKLKKRAIAGLLGILSWWWLAAISLRFVDALAGVLVPSLSEITLFETLSFGGMGVLGVVVALSANFMLLVLIGLIYFVRHIALYLFVLLMPLLIVFWIPGVGPFALVSRFMKRLAGFYVPFLFMTVPVAILFRLGELLGTSADLSAGEFGTWLTALVVPFIAVVSPLVLFWQAGAIFFLAERASRHVSASRVRGRVAKGRDRLATTSQGSRNFVRGVRGDPAVTREGQYVFESGNSRAHATGKRLHTPVSKLRDQFDQNGGETAAAGANGGQSDGTSSKTAESAESENSPDTSRKDSSNETGSEGSGSRPDNFRDPPSTPDQENSKDEPPRYIH